MRIFFGGIKNRYFLVDINRVSEVWDISSFLLRNGPIIFPSTKLFVNTIASGKKGYRENQENRKKQRKQKNICELNYRSSTDSKPDPYTTRLTRMDSDMGPPGGPMDMGREPTRYPSIPSPYRDQDQGPPSHDFNRPYDRYV